MFRQFLVTGVYSFALLLATSFCTAAVPDKTEPAKAPDYYPLQVGNRWSYQVTVNDQKIAMATKVGKMEEINGKKMALLQVEANGNPIAMTEHLQNTKEGVIRSRMNGLEVDPPLLLVKYPVKDGDTWKGNFSAGNAKAKYTASAQAETVEVPAGKFKTIRVAITLEEAGKVVNTSYWFARDVGIVKQTFEMEGLNMVMELEKFEPKADAPKNK